MAISSVNNSNTVELNQRWYTDFFPQVMQKEHNSAENPYRFGEMIEKINAIACTGKKVCLFIGRVSEEPLPHATENEVWVSSDIRRFNSPKTESNQIHLWIDCNQQEAIETLKGLFDRVVIDTSTTKCLDYDFARRFAIMLRSSESSLIFESGGKSLHPRNIQAPLFDPISYLVSFPRLKLDEEYDLKLKFMENYYNSVSKEEQEKDWIKFLETSSGFVKHVASSLTLEESKCHPELKIQFMHYITKREGMTSCLTEYARWGKEEMKSYLEGIYNHVEFHSDEKFPYPENWGGLGYYLVKDFKSMN